ncbi:hypothetical protein ACWCXK_18160 [Streptomyces sp. NPDC001739]|uniref:hypothetical protein n=1 Tax=unclassified Streptomyces TaxID=2593676 RepID=UPI00332B9689
MDLRRGARMRKDRGTPGIPVRGLLRVPLLAVAVVLAFLLGAAAAGAGATATFTAPAAKPAGAPPAVKPGSDSDEEKTKRDAERGAPRGTARSSVGVPRHAGRPLPPSGPDGPALPSADGSHGPAAGTSTRAASRPAPFPVLHCVFRC